MSVMGELPLLTGTPKESYSQVKWL